MIIGVVLPFTPFAAALKMEALPLTYFPWLIGILVCYCLLTQWVKIGLSKNFIPGYS
jgi:Mg2+-importing ATPase